MTRPIEQVHEVLILREEGLGARRIARLTGIPIKTVQGWITQPDVALKRSTHSGIECHGKCDLWRNVEPQAYAYLLGIYLGDGTISRHPRTYRLRISCDRKYPGIMDEIDVAIMHVMGTTPGRVMRKDEGCDEVYSYSSHWPCYFPQHGPGMKHQRKIELLEWQRKTVEAHPQAFIRGLIQSDGCRARNVAIRKRKGKPTEYRYYPRYQFTNKSDDIRALFCWALDLLGIHWTQANRWTISVARRNDIQYMDTFVGPKR